MQVMQIIEDHRHELPQIFHFTIGVASSRMSRVSDRFVSDEDISSTGGMRWTD